MELRSSFEHEIWSLSSFSIDVTLTKKGLENYIQVLAAVFRYLQIIRDAGVQEYVFEEYKRVGELEFQFQDKEEPLEYTINLASKMQLMTNAEELRGILKNEYVVEKLDAALIAELGALIADPMQSVTILRSKSFEGKCD